MRPLPHVLMPALVFLNLIAWGLAPLDLAGAQTSTPIRRANDPDLRSPARPQPRKHGVRVEAPSDRVEVEDGDTAIIHWRGADPETVRFLGIDTPEGRNPAHDLPYAQPFGAEARAFAQGAFAAATRVELLRSAGLDQYRRTLGYFFLNGKSYSVLVVRARLAEESITRYGDNGFPKEAADVMAAAKEAGPLPFESPAEFRRRMREVSKWMKSRGRAAGR